MLQSVSWQQYLVFLLLATATYYLFIWVIYFKAKLPSFSSAGNFNRFSRFDEDEPDEVLSTVQHVIEELQPVFAGRLNKNELILAIQLRLKKYNQWDEPGFRETINDFIADQSESICSIRLGEEDQRAVWL